MAQVRHSLDTLLGLTPEDGRCRNVRLPVVNMGRGVKLVLCCSLWLIITNAQQINRQVYRYSDCPASSQHNIGVSDGSLPNSAMSASSSHKKRTPSDGRVGKAAGAWSPAIQNSYQWLQVDIGKSYIVTAVMLQGRQGSDEYVREFFLEYSDDGETWRRYTNHLGVPEIFEGNVDDSTLQTRVLLYPIVARYIRFNPQRWNMEISLRVEIKGCVFIPETSSYDGESYIDFNLAYSAVMTTQDLLELRFKTGRPDGILMYANGNQGDFMVLEMRRGYLYFKLDLGSTATESGLTEVLAGSLLDDNQWHDLIITRDRKNLKVVVDRLVNEVETNGLFFRLDLDKNLYIGGVQYFNAEGISVKYNFFGCIQNVNLNGARLIKTAMDKPDSTIKLVRNVNPYCSIDAKIPVTFPTLESYLKVETSTGQIIHVAFEFRTHDKDGLLISHYISEKSHVEVNIDENGHIAYEVEPEEGQAIKDVVRNTDVMSNADNAFTDGLWHTFYLYIDRKMINCTVDRNVKVSQRELTIQSSTTYFIGGTEIHNGFRGCMRDIRVAQRAIDLNSYLEAPSGKVNGAQIGSCAIRDRCTPNPCENGGLCEQSWNTFTCKCGGTGYKGELCHTPEYHISCAMHKLYSDIEGKEKTFIDIDGSGAFEPFEVSCERGDFGEIITYLDHDSKGPIRVTGYREPGSYVRKIQYTTDNVYALEELIDRSHRCQQKVVYRCKNARFMADADNLDPNVETWGWWVGRTFQPMYYWGGAAPGSKKCKCGLEEDGCGSGSTSCYCDRTNFLPSEVNRIQVDQGYLEHKEYLPVLEIHLGDTGSATDDKWSEYEIAELECFGDNLFDNTVTFTMPDGSMEFPTFRADNAGDIWFQFKTTQSDGVMIHCSGADGITDFVEIRLFQSDTIQFRYDVGNGVTVLSFRSPSPLSDDQWHTIHVEKNRKQAWIKVDDYRDKSISEDADLVRELDLNTPLFVGSLVDYQDGFVGCMRGLRVNGQPFDMAGRLNKGELYGVRAGCVGKCASNPCFNGGTCREGYSFYTCDCSYTPWRGWNCGREVGVNLKKDYMVEYKFDELQGLSASDFQYATIGFSTKVKQGILMQMMNDRKTEYITVAINNDGGVKVVLDVGFERVEVNTPMEKSIDYANSQVHVATVQRSNYGRSIRVQVDDYPAVDETFGGVSAGSDTILDNPKFLYIGNNDTEKTQQGFEGCIYRMQVDNIFPLKRAFQDPKPDYITLVPSDKLREDMCGFEEITVVPEPVKRRPYVGQAVNVTYRRATEPPLSDEEKALVGVGCTLFIILVICVILFCLRSRFEGADYETAEAKGTEYADNPDTAVVYNQTGLPNMPKSYEYFM